ncbi:MAG: hypothetical protein A3J75_04710 [Acidobacteria bacterium RBG_16_68_9]|nr:MAG: hypothetical protein A3J75_04710 [Acidobacteria bacterium RBG_16_68_9]
MVSNDAGYELEPVIGAEPSFLAASASLRAALGPDTAVTGRLSFTVPTRLDGTLRGEVHATDLLVIGETGFVDGTVRAPAVIILGGVNGNVVAVDRVEVGPHGRLNGSVETRQLVVQEGGRMDGDCRIAPGRATVHVLRPRPTAEQSDLFESDVPPGGTLPD